MNLRDIQARSHKLSIAKGWWDKQLDSNDRNAVDPLAADETVPEKLCLIHSEVSEALESYRNEEPLLWITETGKPEGVAAEIADIVIRCCDLAAALHIDLEDVVHAKHAYNETRPHRHGGKRL